MKRKYLNFCKMGLFFLVYTGFIFIFNVKVWAGILIPISSAVYDGGNGDKANGVTTDGNNNIIVTGSSENGANRDYFTIKYDSNLVVISSVPYDGGNDDSGSGIEADGNNNIIVTGTSVNGTNGDYFTIKYDTNLMIISSASYDGGNWDMVRGIAIDGNNNIIVTGIRYNGANYDYFTIKYDSNLVIIASAVYDCSICDSDYVAGVTTDGNNNIIVTGTRVQGTNRDYFTIKYDSNLVVITSASYDDGISNSASGITTDDNNNIIVTGESYNGANRDYFTIKYDGNLIIISSAVYDGGNNDYAQGVTVDGNNNIIVAGYSFSGANDDYFTIKYDSNLAVISSAIYDGGINDYADGVTTDDNGNIIVAGWSDNGVNDDCFTIKYLGFPQVFFLSPSFGQSGETLDVVVNGINFYNGANIIFSGMEITVNSVNFISATQLQVNVTIDDNAFSGSRDTTVTNIDDASGVLQNGFEIRENISFQEEDARFVKVSPKIFTPNGDGINDVANFIFENPNNEKVEGMIFYLSGSVVRDNLPSSSTTSLIWDGRDNSGSVVSGKVYVYQIKVGGKIFNGTVVVAK